MRCLKCNEDKIINKQCKNCKRIWYQKNKERLLVKRKKYYINNKKRHSEYGINYRKNNKKELTGYFKEYYLNNKKKKINYQADYYKDNKSTIINKQNAREKIKRNNDPSFKLRKNCSRAINKALRGNKNHLSILNYLPYNIEELKKHLESKFDSNMNWDNYGNYWHVDHIIPQSILLYSSMEEENFKKCWSLDNLQPLEAIANIKKSNNILKDT